MKNFKELSLDDQEYNDFFEKIQKKKIICD